jgi:hypothetical protein
VPAWRLPLFPACAAAAPSGEYAVGESPAPAPVMVIVCATLCCAVLSAVRGDVVVERKFNCKQPVSRLISNQQSPISNLQSAGCSRLLTFQIAKSGNRKLVEREVSAEFDFYRLFGLR